MATQRVFPATAAGLGSDIENGCCCHEVSAMSTAKVPDNGDDARNALLLQVEAKRSDVNRYLGATGRRRRRLVLVAIVAGSIAAALTALPALGGPSLTDQLTEAAALATPSWRVLCALATVCSLAATIATQLHESNNYDEQIVRAQGVNATLEALALGIRSRHLSLEQATEQFIDCIRGATFVEQSGAA